MSGTRSRMAGLLAAWLLAAAPALAGAQATTVRGTVVEEPGGAPVAAANVALRSGSTRVQTNDRGEFTIQVASPNDTLVVARIGFTPVDVPLAGRTQVTVTLRRSAVQLTEMVVVGYGTQRRSDVTGSIASVDSTRLQDRPNVSIAQALQGSAPGVNVATIGAGAEPNVDIQIRGRSSITASTTPLIVVDGIPYNGSLADINPDDIASLDVLKDASAAAIYGSRGSNGVVLVTTKRGGTGKPRLAYNGYVGSARIANKPRLMTPAEFGAFKCERQAAENIACEDALTATERANLESGGGTDWIGAATRAGTQQQHNLSVSGGTEETRYYMGGSLLKVSGVAVNDEFDRYTLRLNVDQVIRPWLSIGTNTQFVRSDRSGVGASFSDAFYMNPLTRPYDESGNMLLTPWPEDAVYDNPLDRLNIVDSDVSQRVFTSNYLKVDVPQVEGLSYRLNAGLDIGQSELRRYYGRNTQTGLELGGRAQIESGRRDDWTIENILRFSRTFDRHSLDLTGLYSAQAVNTDENRLRAEGFPNDVLTYYQANVGTLLVPVDLYSQTRLLSQMGRVNYSYDERYLVTATVRRDGYSGFGKNDKYGVFPSLALGWNVSNESWWPTSGPVDMLKLRLSGGEAGNQAVTPYRTLSQLNDLSYLNGSATAPGFYPVSLGNPNLKWETKRSLNLGVDFALWNERLRGTLDLYEDNTSDLLLARAISPVHGITSITQNIGEVKNRGVELQLVGRVLEADRFSWDADFNIAANRNEILDLYGDGRDDLANGWFIGQPIDVNYGYQFAGIWQEGDDIANSAQPTAKPGDVKVRDVNGDGRISPDGDRTFIGSLQPDFTAALTNTLKYRDFTLTASINTVQGITRSNPLLATNQVLPGVRRNTLQLEYWTPENPIDSYPANRESTNPLALPFYQDASFVRLRDLTLAYAIRGQLAARLGTDGARLYVTGRNLWTSTDWVGLDPELSEQRAVPLERTVIAGLSFGF